MICLFNIGNASAQVPVADYFGRWLSKTTSVVQQASEFVNKTIKPLVDNFKDVQKFFKKAYTIVNGVVKNMRLIERIIQVDKEIKELFKQSIDAINAPRDADGDGIDDLHFLDKWKHIQILLGLTQEALNAFKLFQNFITDDALTLDDAGRILFIKKAYRNMMRIKSAMRIQIRRINKEIYQYGRLQKELQVFDKLFSTQ